MSDRRYHNPECLHKSPAFSHGVSVPATARTVYVGGQNATDADGVLVGESDLFAQTVKTLENLEAVLKDADATLHDVVKWSVLVIEGQSAMGWPSGIWLCLGVTTRIRLQSRWRSFRGWRSPVH